MHAATVEKELKESCDVSSYNHALVQVNLAVLLKELKQYDVLAELSIDIEGNEVRPDLCLYPQRGLSRPRDILRMRDMPLLAIEILSPKQGTDDILEKFELYFATGVPSCWLVDPAQNIVSVYADPCQHKVFSTGEVEDKKLGIRLSLMRMFE